MKGATVILACRDRTRSQNALDRIVEATKSRKVFCEDLDLSDLGSIRDFVKRFLEKFKRLDILINNAGKLNDTFLMTLFIVNQI